MSGWTAASRELRFRLEEAWLRRLPLLTRDYLWVDVDGGLRVFGSTRYKRFLYRLMKGYERYTVRLFEEAVLPGTTVLDVGAHIGYYSLVAARKLAGHGRVFAFECDPGNYRFLRHNVRLNGFDGTVIPVPKAVADRAGTQAFYARGGEATQGSLWGGRKGADSIVVECVTADQVVGDARVDVIKMDVEGGEVHALRGMRRALARPGRVTMFVECNPSALAAAGSTPEELLAEVTGLGFRVQVIDEGGRRTGAVTDDLYDPRHRDDEKYFVNLCCARDG